MDPGLIDSSLIIVRISRFLCSSSSERLFQRARVHQLFRIPPILEETGICSVSQVREYTITIAHLSLVPRPSPHPSRAVFQYSAMKNERLLHGMASNNLLS